ncbi:hypothetical protein L7F22_057884 [Adiantum nelumboides]|nr:hypothetical protein [Adiantum nelumboides]
MRSEQGSRQDDSSSAVEEREKYTASPADYCSEIHATAHLALSELNQSESMLLLRGMPSLNLDAMNVNSTDTTKSQKITSSLSETCVLESTEDAHPASVAVLSQKRDLLGSPRVDIESSLIDFVCHDNAEALVCLLRKILQVSNAEDKVTARKAEDFQAVLGFWFPHRLLHLACQLDSVACAQALLEGDVAGLSSPVNAMDDNGKTALHHAASNLSARCVVLLLQKRAKPDINSNDGCTPLKLALQNKRWPTDLQTLPAAETIRFFRREVVNLSYKAYKYNYFFDNELTTLHELIQDLNIIKILACQSKGVLRLACRLAFDGHSSALTALILATGNSLLGEEYRYESFLDLVVERALSRATGLSESQKNCKSFESESEKHSSPVLKCLEIIVCLKGELQSSSSHPAPCQSLKTKPSALLRAAQAGDAAVIKVLLIDRTYIHETDADGNTALHWCLKTMKGLRIIWQLVTLGSAVGARNKLGYTPVHVAAGQGHLQALQLLLAQEPNAVHIAAVTRETPLFLAVKNNHIDCVKLLLQFGSNLQALNLRQENIETFSKMRQRPVDFANSQDMRTLLSENGMSSIDFYFELVKFNFPSAFACCVSKQVEIKAAFHPSKKANEDLLVVHSPKPPRLVSHVQDNSKDGSCNIMLKGKTSIIQKDEGAASAYAAENTSSNHPRTCHPPWLPVFKKWLPAFLSAASARQHGAEFYPLSSVKADFRATCGMELDHAALGFPKLSDFLRTMPELCRMKIVPVGRGPATHVVLQVRPQQNLMSNPQVTTATKVITSSLVHEGRTYAAAASQNIATLAGDDTDVPKNSENTVPMDAQPDINCSGSNHSDDNSHDFTAGASTYYGQQACLTSHTFSLPLTSDQHQTLLEEVPTVKAYKTWKQEFSGNNLAVEHLQPQLPNASMTYDSSHLDTPTTQPPQQQNLLSFLDVYHNPYMEQTIPSSPFQNRAIPSYKQGALPLYNPWNFNVFEGCRNLIQQMNLAATGEDRLDGDNYPMWAFMMQHVLVSKGTLNIVKGIDVCPGSEAVGKIEDVVGLVARMAAVRAILPTVV